MAAPGPSAWARPGRAWRASPAPLLVGLAVLAAWEAAVRLNAIPPYILPGPLLIAQTLMQDWALLSASLWITLRIAVTALLAAAVSGVALAVLLTQSPWLEKAFLPYAVVLQVTPVVAIAPLIIIWVGDIDLALLLCAWLVAFFPILSNTMLGLKSADRHLLDLFALYGASRWQTLYRLKLPTALPFFLGGLRVSGGLALIGAVVAEFVAGAGGNASGLAYRILEASYQLKIPRMFAALALIAAMGVAISLATGALQHWALRRWHDSALPRDG